MAGEEILRLIFRVKFRLERGKRKDGVAQNSAKAFFPLCPFRAHFDLSFSLSRCRMEFLAS